mmetsp:Transcript_14404/g.45312  ORF Transcript_14404/g.45312 Transcript_14404/m.45312 type:complete len:146 (-) Transcript_14404:63-500(-)
MASSYWCEKGRVPSSRRSTCGTCRPCRPVNATPSLLPSTGTANTFFYIRHVITSERRGSTDARAVSLVRGGLVRADPSLRGRDRLYRPAELLRRLGFPASTVPSTTALPPWAASHTDADAWVHDNARVVLDPLHESSHADEATTT